MHDISAADDVVGLCSDLITYDSSNFGGGTSRGERAVAEYTAARLAEANLDPLILESAQGRASVVARVEGTDQGADALLVHGHLDVVPAQAPDWTVDPFSGKVDDDYVWGRGALDMKDMVAMTLATVREWARAGRRPRGDVVLAFVADEEDTGTYGAGFLTRHHPELFEGVTDAIGESGGHTFRLPEDVRVYPIGSGERGTAWMTLTARGHAGHGSRPDGDNAVTRLATAVARIGAYEWPLRLTPAVHTLLDRLATAAGTGLDGAELARHPTMPELLGAATPLVEATLRNSASPTSLRAGYKMNVIPGEAEAQIDGRMLPGYADEFLATIDELIGPDITREFVSHQQAVEAPAAGPMYEAMAAAVLGEDPDAVVVPYCLSGGTDAKWFSRLGLRCYGFTPLWLPPGFSARPLVHGVDERVPIEGLRFGRRVLDTFMTAR